MLKALPLLLQLLLLQLILPLLQTRSEQDSALF